MNSLDLYPEILKNLKKNRENLAEYLLPVPENEAKEKYLHGKVMYLLATYNEDMWRLNHLSEEEQAVQLDQVAMEICEDPDLLEDYHLIAALVRCNEGRNPEGLKKFIQLINLDDETARNDLEMLCAYMVNQINVPKLIVREFMESYDPEQALLEEFEEHPVEKEKFTVGKYQFN